ncbi:MAG: hypothetical protein JWM11_1067 [Planctomycetaceae bacterium]|nr:hypothetical protein [Planctomycetaceae bacterium]
MRFRIRGEFRLAILESKIERVVLVIGPDCLHEQLSESIGELFKSLSGSTNIHCVLQE